MEPPTNIETYLRAHANELGQRILESFPPLQGAQDPTSPLLAKLLRRPYPAQAVAVGGIVKRLAEARSAAVVAECGTGKTLISLASLYVASGGRRFVALAMVPSHLTPKWLREGLTVPTTTNWPFGQLMVPKEDGQDMLPEPCLGARE